MLVTSGLKGATPSWRSQAPTAQVSGQKPTSRKKLLLRAQKSSKIWIESSCERGDDSLSVFHREKKGHHEKENRRLHSTSTREKGTDSSRVTNKGASTTEGENRKTSGSGEPRGTSEKEPNENRRNRETQKNLNKDRGRCKGKWRVRHEEMGENGLIRQSQSGIEVGQRVVAGRRGA